MNTKRRTFSEEFKRDAVKLVTEQGYRISEAARSLGIGANLLGRWKKAFKEHGQHSIPSLWSDRVCSVAFDVGTVRRKQVCDLLGGGDRDRRIHGLEFLL